MFKGGGLSSHHSKGQGHGGVFVGDLSAWMMAHNVEDVKPLLYNPPLNGLKQTFNNQMIKMLRESMIRLQNLICNQLDLCCSIKKQTKELDEQETGN